MKADKGILLEDGLGLCHGSGMSKTMRALAASALGPIEDCKVIDLPIPKPGPGQARVRIVSAAFNPADAKTILGKTGMLHAKGFRLVMGYDLSGVVDAVGAGVDLPVGSHVFGMLAYGRRTWFGSLAEYTVLPARWLAEKPATIDHDTAAAAATAGLTALQGLRGSGRMKAGDRTLVTGASGGVGALVVGVAQALGGQADAVTSKGGMELARSLGAGTVIDRGEPNALDSLTGPYAIAYDAAAACPFGSRITSAASSVSRMTGGAFTPAAREFVKALPNACLDKPLSRVRLCEAIGHVLALAAR